MRYLPALAIVLLSVPSHLDLDAQIIDFSPFPMSGGDQYQGIPSGRRSMGNLSIALRDELADAFINPAEIMRVSRNQIFFSPTFQSWKVAVGNGEEVQEDSYEMLNLSSHGGIVHRNDKFGVAALAGVEYRSGRSTELVQARPRPMYMAHASYAGRRFPIVIAGGGRISGSSVDIGAGVSWTSMNGEDETMLLPREPYRITSIRDRYQLHAGASAPIAGGEVGVVTGLSILHSPGGSSNQNGLHLVSQGETWFARLNYRVPLSEQMDLGVQATGNRTELHNRMNGTTTAISTTTHAFDAGIGATWQVPGWLVGVEYLVEPGFAGERNERVLYERQAIGHLVESSRLLLSSRDDFFVRHALRAGVQLDLPSNVKLRLGSQARTTAYSYDCISGSGDIAYIAPGSSWTELSLTGGVQFDLGSCRLMADGEIVTGRGLPSDPFPDRLPHPPSECLPPSAIITPLHDAPLFTSRLAVLWTFGAE